MTTLRRIAAVALATATALSLASCGGDDAATNEEGLTELTISQIPTMDAGPLYLGIDQGIFEDHGLDVTVEVAESGAAIVPAVVSQESQIGYANIVSDLQAFDQGLPIQLVANCCASGSDPETDTSRIYVEPDGDFTTLESLADANIAVNSVNNLGDLVIRKTLDDAGVDSSGVEFTPMPYSDMPAALERGDVDAIWSVEPHKTISDERGFEPVVSTFSVPFPDMMLGYYITSQQFADQNPEAVSAFQDAMSEANEFATQNPDLVREQIVEHLDLDADLVAQANLGVYTPGLDEDSVPRVVESALEYGMIENEPDYDEIYFRAE